LRTKKIYSKDATYQKFEVLKTNRNKRHRYGQFLVEGVRNINEAIGNGWQIHSFLYAKEKPLSRWARDTIGSIQTEINYELTPALMDELSGKDDTSELMAVVCMRKDDISQIRLSKAPLLMVFDRPSNHGNLGTIIRSCDAFGVDGLIITGHAVDLYAPEVVVASMGSFFKLPAIRIPRNEQLFALIADLKCKYPGFQVMGTTAHGQISLAEVDFSQGTMIMIGNETDGLRRTFRYESDALITIPMARDAAASSLNVGCAASVVLYEVVRQRRG
jgi:TrmH family RNA methyltransferase